jgi:hypothetical protein
LFGALVHADVDLCDVVAVGAGEESISLSLANIGRRMGGQEQTYDS